MVVFLKWEGIFFAQSIDQNVRESDMEASVMQDTVRGVNR